jgi:hypothetical protein
MESDAETQALTSIIKNDRRQRVFIYALLTLMAIVIISFVIGQVQRVLQQQQRLVAAAQANSRTRTEEFRRYITCIFIIPIDQRTVAAQRYCFKLSDLPGGRTENEFTPIEIDPNDIAASNLSKRNSESRPACFKSFFISPYCTFPAGLAA